MTDKPTEFADRINYGQTVQSTRPRTTDKTTIVSRPALASLMIKRTTPVKHDTRAPEFDRIIFFLPRDAMRPSVVPAVGRCPSVAVAGPLSSRR